MKHNKTFYSAFVALLLFNILLRYPVSPTQTEVDGMMMTKYAILMVKSGLFHNWLDLLSFFGQYPFSYPSGNLIFISTLYLVLGEDIVTVTFFSSFSVFFVGFFNIFFLLSRTFTVKPHAILFGMLAFTTSFYFLKFTSWNISSRAPYMAMLPLLIGLFIISFQRKSHRVRFASLLFLVVIILYSLHRMSIISIPLYLASIYIGHLINYSKSTFFHNNYKRNVFLSIIILILIILPLYGFNILLLFGYEINPNWENKWLTLYLLNNIINISIDYTVRTTPFFLVLISLGVFYLIFKDHRKSVENFSIVSLILSTPFFIDREYFIPTFLPLMSILVSYGFLALFNVKQLGRRFVHLSILFMVIGSSLSAIYLSNLDRQGMSDKYPSNVNYGEDWINEQTLNSIYWARESNHESRVVFSNTRLNAEFGSVIGTDTITDMSLIYSSEQYRQMFKIDRYDLLSILTGKKDYFYGGKVETPNGDIFASNELSLKIISNPGENRFRLDNLNVEYSIIQLSVYDVESTERINYDNEQLASWSSEEGYKVYSNGYEKVFKI